MSEMPMPGRWTMSMMWMRMPDQTWVGAATSFLGMWAVMMIAMMLPALVPALRGYRDAVDARGHPYRDRLMLIVSGGYFFVWTLPAVALFPLGAALATIEMQQPTLSRAVPIAVGVTVLIAGAVQFTAWKAGRLACCRRAISRSGAVAADSLTAWRYGIRLGRDCVQCCANLMAILLAIGIMNVGAMTAVTCALTLERLAPDGQRVARATGTVIVAAGLLLIGRAVLG